MVASDKNTKHGRFLQYASHIGDRFFLPLSYIRNIKASLPTHRRTVYKVRRASVPLFIL